MKFALIAIILATGLVVLVACGDGGTSRGMSQRGLTAEQYLEEVRTLLADLDAALDETDALVGDYSDLAAVREAYPGYVEALDGLVIGVRQIRPPDELLPAHDGLEDAANEYRDAYERAAAVVTRARTLDEVTGAVTADELAIAESNLAGACNALQITADANAIEIDLGCPAR